jgi:DNA-binding GntR family transcriptional regulator
MAKIDPDSNMRIVREASPTRRLVIVKITDAIVKGRFRSGDRLVERELCELLGVSRTSVREALRELESEGLITNIPNKGPIVALICAKQAENIYQVRSVLEGLTARLFARRATDAQIDQLEAAIDAIAEVYKDFDPMRFVSAKNFFYDVLLEGADNEVAATALRSIHVRVSQLRAFSLQVATRADASLGELRRLLYAIRTRDEDQAERECIIHVNNAAIAALETLHSIEAQAAQTPAALRQAR